MPTQKFVDLSVSRFSDTSMPALLEAAAAFCASRGLPLVVKVHPHLVGAERAANERFVRGLDAPAVFLSNADIDFLTYHAAVTVTVNGGTLVDNFRTETRVVEVGRSLFSKTAAVLHDENARAPRGTPYR